jgi:hypothetical protein
MAKGYIIIFEGKDQLVEERHPSAVVHKTCDDAKTAWKRGDQVGRPLQIIEIEWDDTGAKSHGHHERLGARRNQKSPNAF